MIMKILFFDGYCSLCNGVIDLLLKIDKKKQLRFCSLQSDFAQRQFARISPHGTLPDSVIFWDGESFYFYTEAVFAVLRSLGRPWTTLLVFRWLPSKWLDAGYRWIAARRFQFFGRRQSCRTPTPEERLRFIEDDEPDIAVHDPRM